MNATNVSVLVADPPLARPLARPITEAAAATVESRWRRRLWRGTRLLFAGALCSGVAFLGGQHWTKVESDYAYINAPITTLRAPIPGQLQIESLEPGTTLAAGRLLFRVENPRFGNLEAMSQLNWFNELADRLRSEIADAELRHTRQDEIFKHHAALFEKQLISRVAFLEEETRVALSRSAVMQKQQQLRSAEARGREIEQHLALQKEATVTMPFDGVVWAVRSQPGSQIAAQEPVLHVIDPARTWVDAFVHEKHADKFSVGTEVLIRAVDGNEQWRGRVESVRAGVGRIDPESSVAVPPGELSRRRVAVRVKPDVPPPFSAAQFLGVGRSVVVSLPSHD